MSRAIHIGLVNNMPDSALDATERQFRTVLTEAADGFAVHLSLFAIPEIPRSDQAKLRMGKSYASIEELWDNPLDGLIVTGAEPIARHLADEPYWPSLQKLIDWARDNTHSCIFSCLAAHAAVLRLDGIGRRPRSSKLCGLFECATVLQHPLTAGLPSHVWMPHSRWNDLPENALADSGYRILTRSAEVGVDTFIKQEKSLLVFFQGHPEYDAASLLHEYERDVRRFLNGESASNPSVPVGYVGRAASVKNKWRFAAVRLYRNWLRYLSSKQNESLYHPLNAVTAGLIANEGRDGPF